jgi:hypothetical protein
MKYIYQVINGGKETKENKLGEIYESVYTIQPILKQMKGNKIRKK